MDERLVERVLVAVELIPPGRVAAYGDLGRLVGTGPRQVGSILRHHGQAVPWWRVTNASGDPPRHLAEAVRHQWADEAIDWKPNGLGCRIQEYRADLALLAHDFARVWSAISGD